MAGGAPAKEDGARLLASWDGVVALGAKPTGAAVSSKPTKSEVDARYKRAQELAAAGRRDEALEEYLWCYDEGMPGIPAFDGVWSGGLVEALARLGEAYPPALAALRDRRDRARERVLAGDDDFRQALQFGSLNHHLKQPELTLSLYDQLPAQDPRKRNLGAIVFEPLAVARRYDDAAKAVPFATMRVMFEGLVAGSARANQNDDKAKIEKRRETVVALAAKHIEVLAGAGDLANAKLMLGRVLEYDDSVPTRKALQERLVLAGHPELLFTEPTR